MLFKSYSYEILYKQFYWIYLQGDIKLLLVTVTNRLIFGIKVVHNLSFYPIFYKVIWWDGIFNGDFLPLDWCGNIYRNLSVVRKDMSKNNGTFLTQWPPWPSFFTPLGRKVRNKVFPYWLPSIWPRDGPSVHAIGPQVMQNESCHKFCGRLPLLSARPAVTTQYPVGYKRFSFNTSFWITSKQVTVVTVVWTCVAKGW